MRKCLAIQLVDLYNQDSIYIEELRGKSIDTRERDYDIIGVAKNYLYPIDSKKQLQVIDITNGKVVTNRRKLLAKQPEVVDLSLQEIEVNEKSGLLTLHSIEGDLYELHPDKEELRPVGEYPESKFSNEAQVLEEINFRYAIEPDEDEWRWLRPKFFKLFFHLKYSDWERIYWNDKQDGDSQRKYITAYYNGHDHIESVKAFNTKNQPGEASKSFIKPEIITVGLTPMDMQTPLAVIRFQAFLEEDEDFDHTYVGVVKGNSELLWQRSFPQILSRQVLKEADRYRIYAREQQSALWLFAYNSRQRNWSCCQVNKISGELLIPPFNLQIRSKKIKITGK